MKKLFKYIVLSLVVSSFLFNAVYFKPLDEIKVEQNNQMFDAKTFAREFMSNKIEILPAINTSDFLIEISKNLQNYCEQNGKKNGINNNYNFIIDGNAKVVSIEEDYVVVELNENNEQKIRIATDFIFGNAIRDGSSLADIGSFQNTMDFNNISVELNNIVRQTIIPLFKSKVKEGAILYFKGAVKVNIQNQNLKVLKVLPLILNLKN